MSGEESKKEDVVKIFVFGILKSTGGAFHKEKCLHIEEDSISGHDMYSVSGMYPASVKGDGTIYGETHTYPASILRLFDRIEGYSEDNHDSEYNLYTRETTTTEKGYEVFYYLFNRDVSRMEKVESGVWG